MLRYTAHMSHSGVPCVLAGRLRREPRQLEYWWTPRDTSECVMFASIREADEVVALTGIIDYQLRTHDLRKQEIPHVGRV